VESAFEVSAVEYNMKKTIQLKNTNNSKDGKRRKRNRGLPKMKIR
jgi:hypothetical protein